jgi:hypothetical protein
MKFSKDLLARFTSRKFLLALVGVITVFFYPMTVEQTMAITALIVSFTVAEGAADIVGRAK